MRKFARLNWILLLLTIVLPLGCDVAVTVDGDLVFAQGTDTTPDRDDADSFSDQHCPAHYEVVAVGTLGGEVAHARGISDRGWVVGLSEYEMISYQTRPYIWIPREDNGRVGTMNALPDDEELGFYPIDLHDINERGEAVGYGSLADPSGFGGSTATAFYWSKDDGIILLNDGRATGISNSGLVVGSAQTSDGVDTYNSGYIWTREDGFSWLPRVPGAYDWAGSELNDVNEAGVAAGIALDLHFRGHAVKYTVETGYSKLPDYGSTWLIGASANAINNNGQIVGSAVTVLDEAGAGFSHPVLWEPNGAMHDLGILAEPRAIASGEAVDINDDGLVVGTDDGHPWVWCGGVKRALNDVIISEDRWDFSWVGGINNKGQIVANGTRNDAAGRPGLLFPVFEDAEAN